VICDQFENLPLAADEDVLICGEHELIEHFQAGTLWREVYAAMDKHKQEAHGGL
jgi:hypothetical protein